VQQIQRQLMGIMALRDKDTIKDWNCRKSSKSKRSSTRTRLARGQAGCHSHRRAKVKLD